MELLRSHIGAALRNARISRKKTLRQIAGSARVSLGYLSEVERGQKEASSELLNSICHSLGLSLTALLENVGDSLEKLEPSNLALLDIKSSHCVDDSIGIESKAKIERGNDDDRQASLGSNAA
ncbi:MAG: helix-turn-helix transcriptional regulator [Actinomycetota bacterium]|nr:helix-turn-helix transcriptional regulator [Actinomycetota bacterium]